MRSLFQQNVLSFIISRRGRLVGRPMKSLLRVQHDVKRSELFREEEVHTSLHVFPRYRVSSSLRNIDWAFQNTTPEIRPLKAITRIWGSDSLSAPPERTGPMKNAEELGGISAVSGPHEFECFRMILNRTQWIQDLNQKLPGQTKTS